MHRFKKNQDLIQVNNLTFHSKILENNKLNSKQARKIKKKGNQINREE